MRPRLLAICGEREPWRREAEVACLNSGTVKESAGLVRIEPIEGPGMCGADFPLKVSALGEGSALGFADEPVRPPGVDPGRRSRRSRSRAGRFAAAALPRRPPQPQYAPPPDQPGAPMSIEAPGTAPAYLAAAVSAASKCSARRRPICRRRRTGSAATASAGCNPSYQCRHAARRRAAA